MYTPEELGDDGNTIDVVATIQREQPKPIEERKEPAPAINGNADPGINSPRALMAAVNETTGGYFNAIPHMGHALEKLTGEKVTGWPTADNTAEYMRLYNVLVAYARDQTASKAAA